MLVLPAILFAGWFIEASNLPGATFCVFKKVMHFDCPGCGMTRAFIYIAQGRILDAMQMNWGAVFLYVLFLLFFLGLLFKRLGQSWLDHKFWVRARYFCCISTVFFISIHWFVKTYSFFSEQSIYPYISNIWQAETWLF